LRFFRGKYRVLKELVLSSFESCTYVPRSRLACSRAYSLRRGNDRII
jgi:hypothetical protein